MRTIYFLLCWMGLLALVRAEPLETNQPHKGRKAQAAQVQPQVAPKLQPRPNTRFYGKPISRGTLPGNHSANPNLNATADWRARHHQHFNAGNSLNARVESAKFRENNRIVGSEKWQGQHYAAFRSYKAQWHDRNWWRHHCTRIILIGGGWYYWDAGFWCPAWGYDPGYSYYPYDGPIYAYNDLPPDQVIANVQSALQQQGYYDGEIDGLLGPLTRAALADYQRDHGLYVTAAIDQPTLASLGMG